MVLVRDLLPVVGLNLKLYDHFIEADDEHFKWSTAPMVDMGTYEVKDLNTGRITPE